MSSSGSDDELDLARAVEPPRECEAGRAGAREVRAEPLARQRQRAKGRPERGRRRPRPRAFERGLARMVIRGC